MATPIGKERSAVRRRFDAILQTIILPALKRCGYEAKRLDQAGTAFRITDGIIRDLRRCELCIADLSGLNPNVVYEIAIRHAWNLPSIIIADDKTVLPFDFKDINTVRYRYGRPTGRVVGAIVRQIKVVEAEHYDSNNIFSETMRELGKSHALDAVFEAKAAQITVLMDDLAGLEKELDDPDRRVRGDKSPDHEMVRRIFAKLRDAAHVFRKIAEAQHEVVVCFEPCLDLLGRM